MNQPLRSPAGNTEYRLLDVNRIGGAQSALVLVALSGGGKRSAAFAFGVLRGMRDIPVRPEGRNSTLLDEVDLLAGVSGGSFPAAHYGLYGKRSFETFPDEFLYADIEAYIWGTFLLPWNWDWVVNPLVGTNDRMTWVYDKLMFHGATFADFYRRGRPQVSINATDISFGSPFGFLPQTFDVICSDLAALPIARAVAASNGFPVLFGPVTLRNYRGPDCPLPSPIPPQAWQRRRKRPSHPRLDRKSLPLFKRRAGAVDPSDGWRYFGQFSAAGAAQRHALAGHPDGSFCGRSAAGSPHSRDQRRRPVGAEPQLAAPAPGQRPRPDHFSRDQRAGRRLQHRNLDRRRERAPRPRRAFAGAALPPGLS